mgnify:CR=1 FL=1
MRRGAWILWVVVLSVFCACETQTPEGIIPSDEMEDLLYDYHVAQALARQSDSTAYRYRLYTEAVFRKYGTNEVQFDSTMRWYTRHSDRLFKIYQRVNARLVEAVGSSASGSMRSRYTSLSAKGDTANVWTGVSQCLLTPQGGNNVYSFTQVADTSYHAGDRLMWHFFANWACREGARSARVVLALTFDNDSVVYTSQAIYGDGEQRINAPRTDLRVKRVSGFIYVTDTWSASFKVLHVSDISLVRMHVKETVKDTVPAASSGSVSPRPVKNGVPDSLRPSRPSDSLNGRPRRPGLHRMPLHVETPPRRRL